MSFVLVYQEASGSYAATSGRVLEITTLGNSPTVLTTFDYSDLVFSASGSNVVATGVISATSGNYYAYQWGNSGGWSLESPWIKYGSVSASICTVNGVSYHLDGTAASGTTVTATYNDNKGSIAGSSILAQKYATATVDANGLWSMDLLQGVSVRFTHSANHKLASEGIVPSATTADINTFAVNI